MTKRLPAKTERRSGGSAAFEREVVAEAVRRFGHPVTDIEALEFDAVKGQIREEWSFRCGGAHPWKCGKQCGRCEYEEACGAL